MLTSVILEQNVLQKWNILFCGLYNVTDLVLKLKKTAHDTLLVYFRDMTLKPHTRYTVRIGFKQGIKGGDVNFEVTNFIVAPDKGLKYTISL